MLTPMLTPLPIPTLTTVMPRRVTGNSTAHSCAKMSKNIFPLWGGGTLTNTNATVTLNITFDFLGQWVHCQPRSALQKIKVFRGLIA